MPGTPFKKGNTIAHKKRAPKAGDFSSTHQPTRTLPNETRTAADHARSQIKIIAETEQKQSKAQRMRTYRAQPDKHDRELAAERKRKNTDEFREKRNARESHPDVKARRSAENKSYWRANGTYYNTLKRIHYDQNNTKIFNSSI